MKLYKHFSCFKIRILYYHCNMALQAGVLNECAVTIYSPVLLVHGNLHIWSERRTRYWTVSIESKHSKKSCIFKVTFVPCYFTLPPCLLLVGQLWFPVKPVTVGRREAEVVAMKLTFIKKVSLCLLFCFRWVWNDCTWSDTARQ